MEKLRFRSLIAANLLAASALSACSIDSYNQDPTGVKCDDGRTIADLSSDGQVSFTLHGEGDPAVVTVRRESDLVSVKAEGNVTGPPQTLESDGFTAPVAIVEGQELSTFGAGAAWGIDATEDSIIIQGTCGGM